MTVRVIRVARGGADAARRVPLDRRGRRGGVADDRGGDPAGGDRDDGRAHARGGRGGGPARLPGRRGRGADRRARRARRAGGRGLGRGRGDLPRVRRVRGARGRVGRGARAHLARAASRRSRRWAGSRRATTSRTASSRARGCPRCCGGSTRSGTSTACASRSVFHAGDGNLHPLVLYDDAVEGEAERAEQCATAILDVCIDAGGSLTGEHGVGVDKACSMPKLFGARRPRGDAAAAGRVRPGGPREPRQGVPDAAALRRGAGAVPRASARAGRGCRASLRSGEPVAGRGGGGADRRRPRLDRARRAATSCSRPRAWTACSSTSPAT